MERCAHCAHKTQEWTITAVTIITGFSFHIFRCYFINNKAMMTVEELGAIYAFVILRIIPTDFVNYH